MTNFISLASFILAVFVFGISIGRLVEKIERFIHEKEDGAHRNIQKTTAVSPTKDLNDSRFKFS